jgi:hypothetical protein
MEHDGSFSLTGKVQDQVLVHGIAVEEYQEAAMKRRKTPPQDQGSSVTRKWKTARRAMDREPRSSGDWLALRLCEGQTEEK